MSEKEFNEIFAKRLRHYLEINDMSQAELAKRLGVGTTSVSNWINGVKTPRMKKIDAMCEIFHCKRSDLTVENDENETEGYYYNPETAKVAQEVYDNPNLGILFDAARDARPEDILKAADYLKAVKAMQLGLDNEGV